MQTAGSPGGFCYAQLMNWWLTKSEPDVYSIDHLARDGTEPWTGVRNYTARNFMRDQMKVGDGIFYYHSSCEVPGIYGIARVVSAPYPDPTQFDPESEYFDTKSSPELPRWQLVDIGYVCHAPTPLTLASMRQMPELQELLVLRPGQRLSIQPVTLEDAQRLLRLLGVSERDFQSKG